MQTAAKLLTPDKAKLIVTAHEEMVAKRKQGILVARSTKTPLGPGDLKEEHPQ